MDGSKFYRTIHAWRLKHVSPRNFVLLLSLLAGIAGGIAAIVLKNAVHLSKGVISNIISEEHFNIIYLILPFLGILLTFLYVKYIVKDNIGHGISRVLQAISTKNGILKRHNTYTSLIASTITVSFGGSVGLEAPIVLTGSALGSNLGRFMRMDYKTITLLIGCGAAGGIAGVFKAPIAAMIFAFEVLMLDLTMSSIIPLLISSASGAILTYLVMGNSAIFSFEVSAHPFSLYNIPFYLALGVFCGFVSLYFTRANMGIEKQFQRIKSGFVKAMVGGLITSLLVFFFPPLFGEGYKALTDLLTGNGEHILDGSIFAGIKDNAFLILLVVSFILVFKVVAMSATTGGGGVGGVFAPSLFMGGVSGFFFSRIVNMLTNHTLPESNFALAGMAGVMAAVMQAPLTAIFLIAEITGGYQFFVPLMITTIAAYLTISPFETHSIYTKRLAQIGELVTHHKDKAALSRMSIDNLIETNFLCTSPETSLGEFVKNTVSHSSRNLFPVVDKENTFMGIIFINDIRNIIFDHSIYETTFVKELMFMPDTWVEKSASMESVAQKFADTSHYNLPVLENGKYIGFVSRANVFSTYRKLVKDSSND